MSATSPRDCASDLVAFATEGAPPAIDHEFWLLDSVLAAVRAEFLRAKLKHPQRLNGPHEGYGVLKEEVDELWDDIKANRTNGPAQIEAIQVAAMAIRFVVELPVRS